MNYLNKVKRNMLRYYKGINDPYKLITNNAFERFIIFINDMLYDIEYWQRTNIDIEACAIAYLYVCYKQKHKNDKSLSRKSIKVFESTLSNDSCALEIRLRALIDLWESL